MQLTYDSRRKIAHLRLRQMTGVQVETVRLSNEVNNDLSPDGIVYVMELLNANARLRACDDGCFVPVEEVAECRIEVLLPEFA